MRRVESLKSHLRPGCLYRRSELEKLSKSVDRELAELVNAQVLVKVRHGLYEYPKRSRFGLLPPDPDKLVKTFLKDDDYLLTSPMISTLLALELRNSTIAWLFTTINATVVLNSVARSLNSA